MAVNAENKFVQSDEIWKELEREIDEIFLFRNHDTRGQVVIILRNDTPGYVAIRIRNPGGRMSAEKTDRPLIFERTEERAAKRENAKKSKKLLKKVLRFFEK